MKNPSNRLDRRGFLKGVGAGAFGLALGKSIWTPGQAKAQTAQTPPSQPRLEIMPDKVMRNARVSLVKGGDRREIVYQALKNIEDDVLAAIGNKNILIKPNFVVVDVDLCATHVDAVRGILDFLKPHYKKQIIIGESTASRGGDTFIGYKNYGYLALEKEYNVKLVNLNAEPWVYRYVLYQGNRPMPIRIISTFLQPDSFIISAAKMKTHDRVLATLSLKNVLIAAPVNDGRRNDKALAHRGVTFSRDAYIHFNLFHLAQMVYPDLGVIDGFTAMEGEGPAAGTPVEARLAMASLDPLAMDCLAMKLMGFDPTQIMYLNALAEAGRGQGDLSKIQVLGTPADQCQYHFKPAKRMAEVYNLI